MATRSVILVLHPGEPGECPPKSRRLLDYCIHMRSNFPKHARRRQMTPIAPPPSYRPITVAPIRVPVSLRKNAVTCGAIARSKCLLSNTTEVAANVKRSLNCVERTPVFTALSTESNDTLYSVRPHNRESPAGVYFAAGGSVNTPPSSSTVPGSVIRSLMCSRLRMLAPVACREGDARLR